MADDIGDVLVLGGAVWSLLAGIGLLMILLGTAFRLRDANDITTLFLVGLFQTWTVPVAAHMVARAARQEGAGAGGSGGSSGSGGPGGRRDHGGGEGGY